MPAILWMCWAVMLVAFPADVFHPGFGCAQRLDEEFVIRHDFCVPEDDFLSLSSVNLCRDHPGEILPEIINPFAVWRGKHSNRSQRPDHTHRRTVFVPLVLGFIPFDQRTRNLCFHEKSIT